MWSRIPEATGEPCPRQLGAAFRRTVRGQARHSTPKLYPLARLLYSNVPISVSLPWTFRPALFVPTLPCLCQRSFPVEFKLVVVENWRWPSHVECGLYGATGPVAGELRRVVGSQQQAAGSRRRDMVAVSSLAGSPCSAVPSAADSHVLAAPSRRLSGGRSPWDGRCRGGRATWRRRIVKGIESSGNASYTV